MTRKIIFYSLVLGLVGLIGWAGYRLFYSTDSADLAKKVTNAVTAPKPQRDSSASPGVKSMGTDVWSDSRLKSAIGSGNVDLKGNAEIQNNLKNLTDLYNRGEDDQLLALVNKLMAENAGAKEYPAFLGDYYYNEGNWAEAEKAITKLVELDPKNEFAKTTLGEVQAIQGKYDEAADHMENTAQQNPRNIDALYGMLSVADMKGNPDEAIKKIEAIAKADPSNGNAATVYADTLMSQNKPDEAKQAIQNAMAADPDNANTFRKAGEFASREGNLAEAVRLFQLAVAKEKYPEGKLLSMESLWQAQFAQGNKEQAMATIDEALVLNPKSENAIQAKKMFEAIAKKPQ